MFCSIWRQSEMEHEPHCPFCKKSLISSWRINTVLVFSFWRNKTLLVNSGWDSIVLAQAFESLRFPLEQGESFSDLSCLTCVRQAVRLASSVSNFQAPAVSELGMRKVQILSWLLQNVKLRRPVQRDQRRFDRRQELHLRVFIGRPTRLLPHAKMLLVPTSFFLCWLDYTLQGSTFSLSKIMWFYLLVSHWEVMAHISMYCGFCFWSAEFALWCKSIISPWPLLKREAFYCSWIRVLFFSKVPSGSE